MRSIGAWKIKKLKKLMGSEMELGKFESLDVVRERIKAQIPEEWYNTWECAYSEIERLVNDFISDYQYGRGK